MERMSVDYDWNGEEFWINIRERTDCPEFLKSFIHSFDEDVILTDEQAEQAREWIYSIDGVDEYCNDYSNGPYIFTDYEEEEEEEEEEELN